MRCDTVPPLKKPLSEVGTKVRRNLCGFLFLRRRGGRLQVRQTGNVNKSLKPPVDCKLLH